MQLTECQHFIKETERKSHEKKSCCFFIPLFDSLPQCLRKKERSGFCAGYPFADGAGTNCSRADSTCTDNADNVFPWAGGQLHVSRDYDTCPDTIGRNLYHTHPDAHSCFSIGSLSHASFCSGRNTSTSSHTGSNTGTNTGTYFSTCSRADTVKSSRHNQEHNG